MLRFHRNVAAFLLLTTASVSQAFEIGVYQTGGAIDSLGDAIAAISPGNLVGSATSSTINFTDSHPAQGYGHFGGDITPFPGGAETDFALHATGMIDITSAGVWTFGVLHDDGVGLWIDGSQVLSYSNLTNDRDTFGTVNLSAGLHALELVFFEHGGGATVELFSAYGSFNSFNNHFQLTESITGDVPVPAPLALFGLGAALLAYRRKA